MTAGENFGPGAPRMFANGAQEYFEKYGANIEHLAKIGKQLLVFRRCALVDHTVASKNHKHSVNNPYSQFRDGWNVEQVLKSTKITNQLTKFMCSPTSVRAPGRGRCLTLTACMDRMALLAALLRLRTSFTSTALRTRPLRS